MYPHDFFNTYWRAELRDEVFVAMPFHEEFTSIWTDAVRPAIEVDTGTKLRAHRVDASILSGSVITAILDGIAHSRIVLADISVSSEGRWRGQRNGNVMYEIGLAHATRQSTEILLIRSDDEPINFDIAQINIYRYLKHDIDGTRAQLCGLIVDTLRQIKQEKSLKVQRTIDLLDANAIWYLTEYAVRGAFTGPHPKNMGESLLSISNRATLSMLQQLGVIRAIHRPADKQTVFFLTEFGAAVARGIGLDGIAIQSDLTGAPHSTA
jgi:hypothetical protein